MESENIKENIKKRCDEMGAILGVDTVPEEVLYGALYDEGYMEALLMAKADEDSFQMLLENPPTVANKSTATLLKGVGLTLTRWAKSGFKSLPNDIVKSRKAICMSCPHLGEPKGSKNVLYKLVSNRRHICKICGCVIESKVKLPDESCPEDRWF